MAYQGVLTINRLLLVVLVAAVSLTAACSSVVVNGPPGENGVTNGTAYDMACIEMSGAERLVIPASAKLERGDGDTVCVYMAKRLLFSGSPPKPMDPVTARRNMGCALRREGADLLVGTYGEWWNEDGSATLGLLFVVPRDLNVVIRQRLSGVESVAAEKAYGWWIANRYESDPSYWYAPAVPANGWTLIETRPDRSRRAR